MKLLNLINIFYKFANFNNFFFKQAQRTDSEFHENFNSKLIPPIYSKQNLKEYVDKGYFFHMSNSSSI